MRTLADIGEDALIARLVSLAPTGNAGEGPGDDCAVVDEMLKTEDGVKMEVMLVVVK